MYLRIASTALGLILSSGAMAVAPGALQPTDKWQLDYGDTQCTAAESFGDASSPIVFGVVPSLSGKTYELLISVPRAGPAYAQQGSGSVDFGQGPINTGALYFGAKGVNQSVYRFRLSAADMERARTAAAISFRSDYGGNFKFALANMPALLDGLRQCTGNLGQYWNMDGRNAASRAVPAGGDVRSLFTAADYPEEALKREEQGRSRGAPARYQLLVDEKGSVAACDVLDPSGIATLDVTFCDVIKERAKFTPAKDAQGEPVRSVFTTPVVTWADHHSAFNNGCTWLTGSATGMLSTCGPRPMITPALPPTSAHQPPPPPPSKH
jgi:hypothetical protein